MRKKLRGLYVIIDPEVAGDRDKVQIARDALAGGARLIQLRDKSREKGLQLATALALQRVCREHAISGIRRTRHREYPHRRPRLGFPIQGISTPVSLKKP